MTKKYTANHVGGPSRIFISQDQSGSYIGSVLFKRSHSGSFSEGTKITEWDIKHFLHPTEDDALKAAQEWIKKEFKDKPVIEEDK